MLTCDYGPRNLTSFNVMALKKEKDNLITDIMCSGPYGALPLTDSEKRWRGRDRRMNRERKNEGLAEKCQRKREKKKGWKKGWEKMLKDRMGTQG